MTTPVIYVDLEYTPEPGDWDAKQQGMWQGWRWRAISAGNQEPMAHGGEGYATKQKCRAAVDQLFGEGTNVYLRQHEQGNLALRMANKEGK